MEVIPSSYDSKCLLLDAEIQTFGQQGTSHPHDSSSRKANLYDAVAGRVTIDGFVGRRRRAKRTRDKAPSSLPIQPDEALFKQKKAPIRYAEDDFYNSDRFLESHQILPNSALLKAIHTYTSDFYTCATTERGKLDWRSMDETALLAFGILLEESAAHLLGATGDAIFVETEKTVSRRAS